MPESRIPQDVWDKYFRTGTGMLDVEAMYADWQAERVVLSNALGEYGRALDVDNTDEGIEAIAALKSRIDRQTLALQRARSELATLQAEVAKLREDAARLDWLDEQALRREDGETSERYYDVSRVRLAPNTFGVWINGDLRRAIDAAREVEL